MDNYIVFFVVAFIVLALLKNRLLLGPGSQLSGASYSLIPSLLTLAERSFYGVLVQAVDSDLVVCSKVRIAEVLKVSASDRSKWQKAFNRISRKHFDFVVCSKDDFSFRYAVELNDSSHAKKKRVERDEFLIEACKDAGFPLVQMKAQSGYSLAAVRGKIKEQIEPPEEKIIPENFSFD